jgi:hypothetical protein
MRRIEMKKLLRFTVLFVFTLGLVPQNGVTTAATHGVSIETVPVHTTPDGFLLGPPVPGASARLMRNADGLTTNVHTSVVSGPGVYSLWWIVFNDPASCTTYLCTYDLPDLAVNAGAHASQNGKALNLSAWLGEGGGPYSGEVVVGDPSIGLTNPEGALVTLIVRYHGPTTRGGIQDQLTQYFGGCPGGAACVDEQIVVFRGDCSGACAVPF